MTTSAAKHLPTFVRPGDGAAILLIDDHEGTREAHSTTLRLSGWTVETAATGAEGLRLARGRSFAVILVDLRLPDLWGIDVLRELKRHGISARIVIVSSFPTFESSFEAAAAGADGYVDGPLFGEEIVAVVAQALTGPFPIRHPSRRVDTMRAQPGLKAALEPRVQALKKLIDDELDQPRTVSEFAARVGWSASTLSHRFHEQTGVSIMEYRHERRLQRAAQLLATTFLSVRQIGYSVGYRSLSLADFRRDFRKRFEMTPKEYRLRFWRGSTE